MQNNSLPGQDSLYMPSTTVHGGNESQGCAVSWSAIIAGAVATAAVSLILMIFGAGIGFASFIPGPHQMNSARALTFATVVWMILAQWAAAGLGGYLTGRLRSKWVGLHTHEVFFRDTAHGFLSWATGSVIMAILVMVIFAGSGPMHPMHNGIEGTSLGEHEMDGPGGYFVGHLFRSDDANQPSVDPSTRAEAQMMLVKEASNDPSAQDDHAALIGLVSAHTGLSESDAEKRVQIVVAEEKSKIEALAKAGSALSFFTVLSMLIGAFTASVAAAIGGRQRDEHLV